MAIDHAATSQSPAPCGSPPAAAEATNVKYTVATSFTPPNAASRTRVVISRARPWPVVLRELRVAGRAAGVKVMGFLSRIGGVSGENARKRWPRRHRPAGGFRGQPSG